MASPNIIRRGDSALAAGCEVLGGMAGLGGSAYCHWVSPSAIDRPLGAARADAADLIRRGARNFHLVLHAGAICCLTGVLQEINRIYVNQDGTIRDLFLRTIA